MNYKKIKANGNKKRLQGKSHLAKWITNHVEPTLVINNAGSIADIQPHIDTLSDMGCVTNEHVYLSNGAKNRLIRKIRHAILTLESI